MTKYIFEYSNSFRSNEYEGRNVRDAFKKCYKDWILMSESEKKRIGFPIRSYQIMGKWMSDGIWKTINNLPEYFIYRDLKRIVGI